MDVFMWLGQVWSLGAEFIGGQRPRRDEVSNMDDSLREVTGTGFDALTLATSLLQRASLADPLAGGVFHPPAPPLAIPIQPPGARTGARALALSIPRQTGVAQSVQCGRSPNGRSTTGADGQNVIGAASVTASGFSRETRAGAGSPNGHGFRSTSH